MIKVLGSTRDSFFSNNIRSLTKEPISHVALEFFGILVMHSNIKGVTLTSSALFREENKVVLELKPTFTPIKREVMSKLNGLLRKYKNSMYDFGAFLFLGISLFLRAKCRLPLPKNNLWQNTGMFLCTELLSEWEYSKEDAMLTPMELINKMVETGDWEISSRNKV